MRIFIDSTWIDRRVVVAIGSMMSSESDIVVLPEPRGDAGRRSRFGKRGTQPGVAQRPANLAIDVLEVYTARLRNWREELEAGRERSFNSIKVVRIEVDVVDAAIASGSAAATHATHLFGPHRRHAVLILQHAIHDEERLLDDDEPIAGKQ